MHVHALMHIVQRSTRYPPCSPTCFDTAGLAGVGRRAMIWRGHKLGGNLRQTNYRCKPTQARLIPALDNTCTAASCTRRGIRDLSTPVVDSELVNARIPLTPRKTLRLIRRRHDKEVGHHWRGNVCVSGSNRDADLSMKQHNDTNEQSLITIWTIVISWKRLRGKEFFCKRHVHINLNKKWTEGIEYRSATVIVKKKILKKRDRGMYLVIHLSCMGDDLS